MWFAGLIVDFFTDDHQHAPGVGAFLKNPIAVEFLDKKVVVGDNDNIDPSLVGSLGDLGVRACAIGEHAVHMQVDDIFVHYP